MTTGLKRKQQEWKTSHCQYNCDFTWMHTVENYFTSQSLIIHSRAMKLFLLWLSRSMNKSSPPNSGQRYQPVASKGKIRITTLYKGYLVVSRKISTLRLHLHKTAARWFPHVTNYSTGPLLTLLGYSETRSQQRLQERKWLMTRFFALLLTISTKNWSSLAHWCLYSKQQAPQ